MDYAPIAVCHPGKIGDALYCLPSILELTKQAGWPRADFYTSEHCAPMKRLMEYQPCIKNFIIPPRYVIKSMDCGVQPWEMPVDEEAHYAKIYQLGFQGNPSGPLPDYIAAKAGLTIPPVTKLSIECPHIHSINFNLAVGQRAAVFEQKYIVLASRHPTSYDDVFQRMIEICPVPVVQVGAGGQFLPSNSIDLTGLDMLEMATVIKHSSGFVGIMSSPLVVANGFNVPKVAPHDGIHWDMSHVLRGPLNHYPVLPSAEKILELLGL